MDDTPQPYVIKLRWSKEDSRFIATIPALPGCIADGITPRDAFEEAIKGMQDWLDTNQSLGRLPPPSDNPDFVWPTPMQPEIKFKRLSPDAVLPVRATPGDAGLDIVATQRSRSMMGCSGIICYHTDLAVEIPEGYVGLLVPRSSVMKTPLRMPHSLGIIDSGYRGEIQVRFELRSGFQEVRFEVLDEQELIYAVGERVAQLVVVPAFLPTPVWAEELSDTERSTGGFGSTGS